MPPSPKLCSGAETIIGGDGIGGGATGGHGIGAGGTGVDGTGAGGTGGDGAGGAGPIDGGTLRLHRCPSRGSIRPDIRGVDGLGHLRVSAAMFAQNPKTSVLCHFKHLRDIRWRLYFAMLAAVIASNLFLQSEIKLQAMDAL